MDNLFFLYLIHIINNIYCFFLKLLKNTKKLIFHNRKKEESDKMGVCNTKKHKTHSHTSSSIISSEQKQQILKETQKKNTN